MPRRRSTVRTGAKSRNGHAKLDASEVSDLFDQLQAEERSEAVWSDMISPDEDGESWSAVEEHLLHQPHERNHALRRWKYFGK